MAELSILLIDDHAMFRAGLRMVLVSHLSGARIFEAGSLNEATQLNVASPDVILLDIKLPGLSGMEGIALLRRQWPESPVLMLSAQDEPEMVRTATARGAAGFVSKAESAERIVEVIEQVLRNEHPAPAEAEADEEEMTTLRLTPRQCEVLELLCQGLSNKLIARRLDLSENTVRWHVQAILSALQVSSRSEAAFAARQLGLVG